MQEAKMPLDFPKKKYNIIYADPPWEFGSKEYSGRKCKRFIAKVNGKYKVQNLEWIKNLPVKNISKTNCALFLWTTDAHLQNALEVIDLWGFKYITIAFIWDKKRSNTAPWIMKNYEICIMGTKGRMLQYKKINNIQQKIECREKIHSRKPDIARQNIEKLFGDISRIELFARQRYAGWDAWGDEMNTNTIVRPNIKRFLK